MADEMQNQILDQLLESQEPLPPDEFVLNVMHQVQRQQKMRRMILLVFGLIGAVFGVLGAILLSEPISELFLSIPAMSIMQAMLFMAAAISFYIWFMNDDLGLPN